MDEGIRYLASVLAAGGVWLVVYSITLLLAAVILFFMAAVAVRSAFWLWGRLPLWEAQDYRQVKLEQDAWQDDENETRFLHVVERQRRKWNHLLNGIIAEIVVLLIFTLLVMGSQPVAWLVLALGSVIVGMLVLVAWL